MRVLREETGRLAWLLLLLSLAAICLAQESYSGLDDDYGNQVGRQGGSSGGIMTYAQALQKAQQGQADHEVLAVFRNAYEEVRRGYNEQLINERKTNLAALLLDVANKEGDPNIWTAMYKEAQALSEEVLEVYPDDDAAKANAKAAKNSLSFRSKGMAQAVPMEEARPKDVSEARSFIFDEDDEDEEDLRDQEGDDDEEEDNEKVHIQDEDDEDDEDDDLPPAKKNPANAGAAGKSGAPALPGKSLCDGDSCSALAEDWLGAWGKEPSAWAQVLQDIKGGKLAVVEEALKAAKADSLRTAAAALKDKVFTVKAGKEPFQQSRAHVLDSASSSFPKELQELTALLEGAKMKEVLGQASGVALDGPVVTSLVWRMAGDHARVNGTGADVDVDGSTYRKRIGFRLELPLDWTEEWGGETAWASPLYALAPKHNQMLFFPAGPAQAVLRVSSADEVSDAKKLNKAKHLVLEGWYTTSKLYDSKMLEKGYDILKSRAKGADSFVVGHRISGSSGSAEAIKTAN